MKNLMLLCALAFAAYMYTHPRVQETPVVAEVPPAPVHAPAPPPQKLYYHSPLDAPAMSTSTSTGTGYFSTDENSRFNGAYYSSAYSNRYPAYSGYPVGGGSVTNNNVVTYNNVNTAARSTGASYQPSANKIAGRLPTSASDTTRTGN